MVHSDVGQFGMMPKFDLEVGLKGHDRTKLEGRQCDVRPYVRFRKASISVLTTSGSKLSEKQGH